MTERDNKSRRKYSKEFKVDAVELMMRSNKSIIETATSLGIRADLLRRWEKEYSANKTAPFPGSGHLKEPEEERFRKLERELRIVTEEREILKKALAVFSRTPF
ncbi:MAG: transposase [Chlorobiaceae bacterium]